MLKCDERRELLHSVELHLKVMDATSHQLCLFLLKTLDFMPPADESNRLEMGNLAYLIIEGLAIHLMKLSADRSWENRSKIDECNQKIAELLRKNTVISDKLACKDELLKRVSDLCEAISRNGRTMPKIQPCP